MLNVIQKLSFSSWAAIGVLMMVQPANADQKLAYRTVTHSTGTTIIDAADGVEGHVVGAAKFVGISMLDGGQIAAVAYVADIDYVKGNGKYSTYETFKFDDGSTLVMRDTGSSVTEGTKTTFPDGKTEVIGGTGKYKGASGTGEFHGGRILPFADGGDSYFEGTVTLKEP